MTDQQTQPVGYLPVAVSCGIELKLPSGRSQTLLFCSENLNMSGFFVEGARPSDEDEDRIRCPHCETPHYVVALATALEEQALRGLEEAAPSINFEALLAILIRDGERKAS